MSITIGTVTIARNPSASSDFWARRLNQDAQRTADGGRGTYDNGPNELHGILVLKGVSKTEGDALRTYLRGTALFEKNSFTITPPANTDIGAGKGVAITTCYYDGGPSEEGVFSFVVPDSYDIKFPYTSLL